MRREDAFHLYLARERQAKRLRKYLAFSASDQLRHPSTLVLYLCDVIIRVFNELFDRFLVSKHAILLLVLKYSKIGFTGHQKPAFDDVDQAKAEKV